MYLQQALRSVRLIEGLAVKTIAGLVVLLLFGTPGPDALTFTAKAKRWKETMTINGKTSLPDLILEVTAQGEDAQLVVATREPIKLRKAVAADGASLGLYVEPWTDGTGFGFERDSDDPEDQFEFRMDLSWPAEGVQSLDLVDASVSALVARERTQLSTNVRCSKKPKQLRDPALERANVSLSIRTSQIDTLYFEFQPQKGSEARVTAMDVEMPRYEGRYSYSGSSKIHFGCPGHVMGRGYLLSVTVKDSDGREHTVFFSGLKGTEETTDLESDELAFLGIRGTLVAKTAYSVRAEWSGPPHSLGDPVLQRGGKKAASFLSSGSGSRDTREITWMMLDPPDDELKLVAMVYSGLKWKDIPFLLEDVAIED